MRGIEPKFITISRDDIKRAQTMLSKSPYIACFRLAHNGNVKLINPNRVTISDKREKKSEVNIGEKRIDE